MATTNTLRPLLDRKIPELCTPAPAATAAAAFVVGGEPADSYAPVAPASDAELYMTSASLAWLYVHEQDAWVGIPASGLAGTYGAGTCGCFHPIGGGIASEVFVQVNGVTTSLAITGSPLGTVSGGQPLYFTNPNTAAANLSCWIDPTGLRVWRRGRPPWTA